MVQRTAAAEKCGFSMIANVLPNGSATEATLMPSPTSCSASRDGGARRLQSREFGGRIRHAPVGDGTARTGRAIRDEAQFEAADREADVERLIEVGRHAQHVGVPRLAAGEVGDGIDHGAQAENHGSLLVCDRRMRVLPAGPSGRGPAAASLPHSTTVASMGTGQRVPRRAAATASCPAASTACRPCAPETSRPRGRPTGGRRRGSTRCRRGCASPGSGSAPAGRSG